MFRPIGVYLRRTIGGHCDKIMLCNPKPINMAQMLKTNRTKFHGKKQQFFFNSFTKLSCLYLNPEKPEIKKITYMLTSMLPNLLLADHCGCSLQISRHL